MVISSAPRKPTPDNSAVPGTAGVSPAALRHKLVLVHQACTATLCRRDACGPSDEALPKWSACNLNRFSTLLKNVSARDF
jgi:hypothetical protein